MENSTDQNTMKGDGAGQAQNGQSGPAITSEQAQDQIATKTAPKISKEGVEAKIQGVSYAVDGTLTTATMTMHNGFKFVGTSACVSPENFNAEIGQRLAYDDALRDAFSHEAYLLAEQIHAEAAAE